MLHVHEFPYFEEKYELYMWFLKVIPEFKY